MADDAAKCPRCGEDHEPIACPHVKAVEFDATGLIITRLEFLTPADYEPRKEQDKPESPREDYDRLGQPPRTGAA